MSGQQIIVDINNMSCLVSAISAREYVETAKNSIPIVEPHEHYFSLYQEMKNRAPGFSHPQLYAILSALFDESTTLYDDYKCSFAYPFLLKLLVVYLNPADNSTSAKTG